MPDIFEIEITSSENSSLEQDDRRRTVGKESGASVSASDIEIGGSKGTLSGHAP
jgi:hypothetical protein